MLLHALLFAAIQQATISQHPSNFSVAINRPDPNNGYDDYVRATDLIESPELELCLDWSPSQVDQLLASKSAAAAHPGDPKHPWGQEDETKLAIAQRIHDLDYLGVQRLIEN